MIALTCNYCQSAAVIRFGKNTSGKARFRCKECGKTWVQNPQARTLSDSKASQVVAALAERISQRGIARTLKVSRDTIRALRKKTQTG